MARAVLPRMICTVRLLRAEKSIRGTLSSACLRGRRRGRRRKR